MLLLRQRFAYFLKCICLLCNVKFWNFSLHCFVRHQLPPLKLSFEIFCVVDPKLLDVLVYKVWIIFGRQIPLRLFSLFDLLNGFIILASSWVRQKVKPVHINELDVLSAVYSFS